MNPLIQLLRDHALYFLRRLPEARQSQPCEIMVCVYSMPLKAGLVCGAVLWSGVALACPAPTANAFLLAQPAARKKYYVYGVIRSASAGVPLRYTYVLPPHDMFDVELLTPNDSEALLELDISVVDYAKTALANR